MLKKPVNEVIIREHRKKNDTEIVPSRYEFLKAHKGIRPNALKGLLGPTSIGKSTLAKCVVAEAAAHVKILIWLSEETVAEYQDLISELDSSILKNIVFVEERTLPMEVKADQDVFLKHFERLVQESGCYMVLVDNITTSAFYNGKFGIYGQNKTADFLIEFVKRVCTVFYVAHTGKHVTDNYSRMAGPEDIRGSGQLTLITEYLYILQRFTSSDNVYNILRNSKFRFHKEARGYFSLVFAKGAYVGDGRIPFEMINYIFNERDWLGKKTPKSKKKLDPPPKFDEQGKLI